MLEIDNQALVSAPQRVRTKSQLYRFFTSGSIANLSSAIPDFALSNSAPSSGITYLVAGEPVNVKLRRAAGLAYVYDALDKTTMCVLSGITGTIPFAEAPSSPSAYPLFVSGYVNHLEETKRTLETRVATLEHQLSSLKVYLPTIQRLVEEYSSAGQRVKTTIKGLGVAYNPKGAWEIAKKRDALSAPMDEDLDEDL